MEFSTIESALAAIRRGEIVVVVDDQNREHEGDLIAAAEFATPDIINFMVTHGKGLVCAPLDTTITNRLNLIPMAARNRDPMGTAFTLSVDHATATTGISAAERALSIKQLADPKSTVADFRVPGHVFPLIAADGGVLTRPGHTEAAVDLARFAGLQPAAVICEILKDDGSMARTEDLKLFAKMHGLPIITVAQLIAWRSIGKEYVVRDSVVALPTEYGTFTAYTYYQFPSGQHHIALVMEDQKLLANTSSVLVRMHSECLTGDVFHSLRCDCGKQLDTSLKMIAEEGVGVLMYLRQEGRGIGLPNKMRAYHLQEQGHDTVDANLALGFAADEREYSVGADILRDLGVNTIRLLTNNPHKMAELESWGIHVAERIPVIIPPNALNKNYLDTKAQRMGHVFS
ncbi:MAG: bifunctional 3,4-dihydroxy-2-butanone-4-phosphate synthase/GTP cyclohydrolase II [Spirochaetaceae bacterium]|jgi:3,4-dihydroxy 2-butanone 4-phosphate synthase/GTP cyclohydrolase II|nr:bifunctional 3,4-dihydroxy-2-butanone-4-phosphate synthase/GTP cyclohydrolase II [Spirochaetaceae bacterium]